MYPSPSAKDADIDFPVIRSNQVVVALKRVAPQYRELLTNVASAVGRVLPQGKIPNVLGKQRDLYKGSGVYIGNGLFLTARHVTKEPDTQKVRFVNFNLENYPVQEYSLGNEVNEATAKEAGLLTPKDSDITLVTLEPNEKYGDPKEQLTGVPLKTPHNPQPKHLIHFGFPGNTNTQMISTTHSIPIPLAEANQKGLLAIGKTISWNGGYTKGEIINIDEEFHSKITVKTGTERPRTHTLTIRDNAVYLDNAATPLEGVMLNRGTLYGHGHIISTHKTRGGSSGGLYINLDGEIIGIHIGAIKPELLTSAPEQLFHPHLIGLPWSDDTISFLEPYYIPEGLGHLSQAQVGCFITYNRKSLGQIIDIETEEVTAIDPKTGNNRQEKEHRITLKVGSEEMGFEMIWFYYNFYSESDVIIDSKAYPKQTLGITSTQPKDTRFIEPKPIYRNVNDILVIIYFGGDAEFTYEGKKEEDQINKIRVTGHQEKHLARPWPRPTGAKSHGTKFPPDFGFKDTIKVANIFSKHEMFTGNKSDIPTTKFQINCHEFFNHGLTSELYKKMGSPKQIEFMDTTYESISKTLIFHFYPI